MFDVLVVVSVTTVVPLEEVVVCVTVDPPLP